VNGLAQAAIKPMLSDAKHAAGSVVETKRLREHLVAGLKTLKGVAPCPSEANFVLCRLDAPRTASKLQRELLHEGILIRSCAGVLGLGEEWIRLAVWPEREEDELIDALREILGSSGEAPKTRTSRKAKSILVVGTTSDSGKSVSATALCRVFSDMGLKTAPFKAQNMSLNSFVTKEGGEMGRAQVVQAAAARVEPHTDMNPVLLKPLGDARSQVIVDGQPVRNAGAREYYTYKDELGKRARDAFDRLAARNDVIVMEGAGSPTEINLLENDFVNMRMAEHAQAPTILVADIDRGGVFASIYGTIRLLPPKWRKLISGWVINKFRGDKSLLDPGVAEIERLTGVPILGVVPSSTARRRRGGLPRLKKRNSAAKALIDIAVLRLPMLSNFTDFAAFEAAPSVAVRYVSSPKHLGSPDMLIIPAANTIHDMLHLRESGFEARIKEYRDKGGFIVGVCGGYQIMGERIDDPLGLEGPDKSCPGLGILPCATVMEPRKELAQVSGMAYPPLPFLKGGCPFHGYEIHCGRTSCEKAEAPLKILSRGGATCEESVGSIAPDGLAFGSYIHGIFDSDELRAKLLNWLCERKGVDPEELLAQTPRAEAQEKEISSVSPRPSRRTST
jgi:cobyric acid synthase CobQ